MKELPVKDGKYWVLDGCTYGSKEECLFTGYFNLCGCHDDGLLDLLLKTLGLYAATDEGPIYYDTVCTALGIDKLFCELILHTLDTAGLIEHGTAIRGSWITSFGREVFKWWGEA